jgi:hypothetical protein
MRQIPKKYRERNNANKSLNVTIKQNKEYEDNEKSDKTRLEKKEIGSDKPVTQASRNTRRD